MSKTRNLDEDESVFDFSSATRRTRTSDMKLGGKSVVLRLKTLDNGLPAPISGLIVLIIGAVRAVQCGHIGNVQTRPATTCTAASHDRDSSHSTTNQTPNILFPRVARSQLFFVFFLPDLIQPPTKTSFATNNPNQISLLFFLWELTQTLTPPVAQGGTNQK